MTQKAPGKSEREGITLLQAFDMFPDDATAEAWFVKLRWPDGVRCPYCDGERIGSPSKHPTMPYHCRACRKFFSVKTGSVMHGSKLGYRKWALATYILTTGIKGTSSMKLHRDLGVTQKTAWYLAHRIRETWAKYPAPFAGPVEVDETYVGGKEANRHQSAKHGTGPAAGKTVVVGAKDRATKQVVAEPVSQTDKATLQGFVADTAAPGAAVYTDEHPAYRGLPNHQAVKHSVKEYVRGQVSTQGIDSFWSMVKRGYVGTFHHYSPKHLHRYINEFSGRHNVRPQDTADQLAAMAGGFVGKRLRYQDLIAGGPAYPPPEAR